MFYLTSSHPTAVIFCEPFNVTFSNFAIKGASFANFSSKDEKQQMCRRKIVEDSLKTFI